MQLAAQLVELVLQHAEIEVQPGHESKNSEIIAARGRLNLAAMGAKKSGLVVSYRAGPTGDRDSGIDDFQHESTPAKRFLRREGRTAAAGARGVRIDEVESLTHQRLFVVQRHAVQIEERLGIDEDAHAVELVDAVAFAGMGIELD